MNKVEEIKKTSLLIVEDEVDLLDILRDLLSDVCSDILVANNGKVALELMEQRPDLCAVLSDVNMPIMDGLTLLLNIRSAFNPIPFVILTGMGDTKSYREAVKLGATDFLSKPFEEAHLRQVMTRAIDFGAELRDLNKEIDNMAEAFNIPKDRLEVFKRVKRTAMAMRSENKHYLVKK